MLDKDKEIAHELGKPINKLNKQQAEIINNIDEMLSYGSPKLGLNNTGGEGDSEERLKEDLKK